MSNSPPRVYCDSSLFLAFIGNEPDAQDVERLLDDAEAKKIEVFTSIITMSEVAFAQIEKSDGKLDQAIEDRIDALWDPPSPVTLIEFHAGLARAARRLMRDAIALGWNLRPFDAIHLATATSLPVDQVYSTDAKWPKYQPLIKTKIGPLIFAQTQLSLAPAPKPIA